MSGITAARVRAVGIGVAGTAVLAAAAGFGAHRFGRIGEDISDRADVTSRGDHDAKTGEKTFGAGGSAAGSIAVVGASTMGAGAMVHYLDVNESKLGAVCMGAAMLGVAAAGTVGLVKQMNDSVGA